MPSFADPRQATATAIFWVLLAVVVLLWISHMVRDRCDRATRTIKASASSDEDSVPHFRCGCANHRPTEDVQEAGEGFYAGDPQQKPLGFIESIDSKYLGDYKDITSIFKTFDKPILGNLFEVPAVKDLPGEKEPAPIPQPLKLKNWTFSKNNELIRNTYKTSIIGNQLFTSCTHGSKNVCVVYFVPKGKGILADEAAMKSIKATLASGIEALQNKLYAVTNGHLVIRKVYGAVCEVDMDGRYSSIGKAEFQYDLRNPKLSDRGNQGALRAASKWVANKLNWDDRDIFTCVMTGTPAVSIGMLSSPAGLGSMGTFNASWIQTIHVKGNYFSHSTVLTHEFLHNLGVGHTNDPFSIMRKSSGTGTRLCSLFVYQLGCMNRVKYISIDKLSSATVSQSDLPDARDACAILYVPVFRIYQDSSHTDWVPYPLGSISRRGSLIEVYLYLNGTLDVFEAALMAAGGQTTLTVKNVPPYCNLNNFITAQEVVNSTLGLQPRPSSISFKVQVNRDFSVTVSAA